MKHVKSSRFDIRDMTFPIWHSLANHLGNIHSIEENYMANHSIEEFKLNTI